MAGQFEIFTDAEANVRFRLLGADGTVGISAEGPQSMVLEFRRWLRSPDAPGQVDNVDESISRATGAFSNFRVVY